MTALQGIWARALQEYREWEAAGSGSQGPEAVFCQGYVLGVAFGLALASVRPDLVETFVPQFRRRGWLQEHEGFQAEPAAAAGRGRRTAFPEADPPAAPSR